MVPVPASRGVLGALEAMQELRKLADGVDNGTQALDNYVKIGKDIRIYNTRRTWCTQWQNRCSKDTTIITITVQCMHSELYVVQQYITDTATVTIPWRR